VVLVTGAAGGIGRAIAERFAHDGDVVVLADLDEARLRALSAVPECMVLPLDVTDPVAVIAAVADIEARYGRLDVLVNNAGILRPTGATEISPEEWDLVLGVNLTGAFLCSQAAYRLLGLAPAGRIVNMSSTAGKSTSTLGGAHYTAAKAGLLGLTRHLAREFARDGVTVNAVCPGLIDTEMVAGNISAEQVAEYARTFPISRLGRPAEVADLVAFLASDQASYITGTSADINGGDLTI
jgi:NAD(P)-dependent dehydrogenase (short-subunit alcohol dehydrogenase family)